METQTTLRDHTRRNRMIAIVAGVITVIAIVLGFAAEFLGIPWHWLRPAAELLLLAELVGLVVLERHQLFEPVHAKVSGMETHMAEVRETLATANLAKMGIAIASMTELMNTSGQTTLYTSPPEVLRGLARTAREAFAREQQGPQILYFTRLAGAIPDAKNDPEFPAEIQEWMDAVSAFRLLPGSSPDSRTRLWAVRGIATYPDLASHEAFMRFLPALVERNPLNMEIKLFVRPLAGSLLTPELVSDRDCVVTFNDALASFRWGVLFRGQEYKALFARWLDDLWASIPDTYLVYSRNGLNQKTLDLVSKELEAAEALQARSTA